ncbi:MAG: MMPL family transporter [Planctomycetes bacterium]|nr:MMPL family transporter [Planctomycetota bacterium]
MSAPTPERQRRRVRLMDWLYRVIAARSKWIIAALALSTVVCAWLSWTYLKLDADTDSLIGENQPFLKDYRRFKHDFGDLEYVIAVVDPRGDSAAADRAVRALTTKLAALPSVSKVHGFIDAQDQWRLAPRAMADAELAGLADAAEALPILAARPTLGTLLAEGDRRIALLLDRGSSMDDATRRPLAASAFLLLGAAASGQPGAAPLDLSLPRETIWLTNEGGQLRLVLVLPVKNYESLAVVDESLVQMRRVIEEIQAQEPAVEIGLTGKPVLQADEMETTNSDMNLASMVALGLCAALFMAVFRGVKRPLFAVAAFLAGSALTYGAALLMIGSLNLLSVVFMLVLVGVGLDYGIHMIARYLEGLRHLEAPESVRHMMRTATPSMLAGAAVSSGTFLIAIFVPMQGLRELGIISGVGLLLCGATMAVGLPALLLCFDRRSDKDRERRSFFISRAAHSETLPAPARKSRHWMFVALSMAAMVAGVVIAWERVGFESNLLKLQAANLPSVGWQRRLQTEGGNSTWFGAVMTDSFDEVAPLVEKASAQPLIGQTRSVLDFVKPDSPKREALRRAIAKASALPQAVPVDRPLPELARRAADRVDSLANGANTAGAPAADIAFIRNLALSLHALQTALEGNAPEALARAEPGLALAANAAQQLQIGAGLSIRESLPPAVRDSFTSENNRYATLLHPKEDIWEPGAMAPFVAAMREVDPSVTGAPITVFESMQLMRASFLWQGLIASAFVLALLYVDFHSVRLMALAFLSLLAGLGWTVGLMGVLNIPFTLANFFAIPIMIGLGIDSAIHITHRVMEGGLTLGFGSTRRAVVVTALTTTIGFGTLLFAQHRGLRGLGEVMTLASLCCLVSSVWLLPSLLRCAGCDKFK